VGVKGEGFVAVLLAFVQIELLLQADLRVFGSSEGVIGALNCLSHDSHTAITGVVLSHLVTRSVRFAMCPTKLYQRHPTRCAPQ
jgi:hypothetical protein